MNALRDVIAAAALTICALGVHAQTADKTCPAPIPPTQIPGSDDQDVPMDYCFTTIGKTRVLWLYGGVGTDSARNVERGIRQTQRYQEVWLNSPGGQVNEGLRIGVALRQNRAHVRVPAQRGVYCVSACTILQLGGYDRTIDPGAKFIVHAMSGAMQLTASARFSSRETWGQWLDRNRDNLETIRRQIVERYGENRSVVQLLYYYQQMIGGSPNDAEFQQLMSVTDISPYGGAGAMRSFDADYANIRERGIVALQEIVTQVELGTMARVHDEAWRRRRSLGRGAEEALKILHAGLNCRIQDLCLLERHQAESLGYHNFTPL